jgi:glyoxylase-like metal-dependent hydrolase (beta-lactamase superfamily II)
MHGIHYKKLIVMFLAVIFVVVAMLSSQTIPFDPIRLTDRVLILRHAPWAETMTVIEAGPSLIVVDTWGSLKAAREARVMIDGVFHKPVSHVFNTHHHWDHTFGNGAFPGAAIIGHRFCAEDMAALYSDPAARETSLRESAARSNDEAIRRYILEAADESSGKDFPISPPNHPVGGRDTIHVGDLSILTYHTPGIHTRSNLTILIPELGIIFSRWEFSDSSRIKLEPGADPKIIADVLKDILSSGVPIRYLIPGHGEAIENPDLTKGLKGLEAILSAEEWVGGK